MSQSQTEKRLRQELKTARDLLVTCNRIVRAQLRQIERQRLDIGELRELLREIDVAYVNKKAELPRKLHGKIVNIIGVFGK